MIIFRVQRKLKTIQLCGSTQYCTLINLSFEDTVYLAKLQGHAEKQEGKMPTYAYILHLCAF